MVFVRQVGDARHRCILCRERAPDLRIETGQRAWVVHRACAEFLARIPLDTRQYVPFPPGLRVRNVVTGHVGMVKALNGSVVHVSWEE